MQNKRCPICGSNNTNLFIDLGYQPPANDLKDSMSTALNCSRFDLSLLICYECLYVWLREKVPSKDLFSNNTYLTGVSSQTREDMKDFAEDCLRTCNLSKESEVLDIASNDGTLLSFFKKKGYGVLGVDPSEPAFKIAQSRGIETVNAIFDSQIAEKILSTSGKKGLITATNIITHVANPEDFVVNCKKLLNPSGSVVFEFYNFESMISNSAFDQIYHEHISYFNFTTFSRLLNNVGMEAYKVKQVESQGGSLRVFVSFPKMHIIDKSVNDMLELEGGIESIKVRYMLFPKRVNEIKGEILNFVSREILAGNKIAGYGASAKSTVLLNFLKLSNSQIIAIADKSPLKQGRFIPGVAIPVISPDELIKLEPNVIIILAWNLKKEIVRYLRTIFHSDVRIFTFVPEISPAQSIMEG